MKPTLIKIVLCLLLLGLNCAFVSGQNEVIKQLEDALKETTDDYRTIDLLNELSYEYYRIDLDKNFAYGDQALQKARRIGYQKGIAQALNYIAIYYSFKEDYAESIALNEESLDIARQICDTLLMSNALNDMAIDYQSIGLTEQAVLYYQQSLACSAVTEDDKLRCFTYLNLGLLYDELGVEEKAIDYYNRAQEIAKESDHHMIKYMPELNLGEYYQKQAEYDLALMHMKQSYELCTGNLDRASVLMTMATVYQDMGNLEAATRTVTDAIASIEASGNIDVLKSAQLLLAEILLEQNKTEACLATLKGVQSNQTAEERFSMDDAYLHHLLGKAHQQKGNYKKAALYFEQLSTIQDTIYDRDLLHIVSELEVKYEVTEKEKENTYLRSEQEKNEIILEQRRENNLYAYALSALIFIIAILVYLAYRNNQRFSRTLEQKVAAQTEALQTANNQLKLSNIELERFAFVASHDLKEPLRNISSFSTLLKRRITAVDNKEEIMEFLDFIVANTKQMNSLIRDLLEYSQYNSSDREQLIHIQLTDIIKEVQQTLLTDLENTNTTVQLVNNSPALLTYPSQLFLVFKNLISNGIKYNRNTRKVIRVNYTELSMHHQFCVSDNGIGIEPQYQEQVFEMFKRLHTREEFQGSGLGLAICKKIVTSLGGRIWYESSEEGTVFYFTIAKNQPTLTEDADEQTLKPKRSEIVYDTSSVS